MDELEILKKQWKKEEAHLPKLKFEEIYRMILKRSSSAVKWIFVISILELAFGIILPFIWQPSYGERISEPKVVDWITWLALPIGIYFIYRFFRNYQKVSTTSTVKELLKNIMKARRTVRLYISINLVLAGIMAMIMMVSSLVGLKGGWDQFRETADLTDYLVLFGISAGISLVVTAIFLLIYLLLYGILMRKLRLNYKELKKMEL